MNRLTSLIVVIVLIVLGFGIQAFVNMNQEQKTEPTNDNQQASPVPPPAPVAEQLPEPKIALPVSQADERVTKKPFGIYITKANSPVQPERFSGYHTGTDFETFPDEADADVEFFAICEGEILQKRTAAGYGDLMVQSCTIDDQSVTVVYGHVNLSSIKKKVGENLIKGEMSGILGQPPSDTDGERKHLHLGIHKGTAINISGYVSSESLLENWLDYQKL